MNDFMFQMIRCELEDVVGRKNVSVSESDKISHSIDYFWLSRLWEDRGRLMPLADMIVYPANAEEVSKILVIADYYKIPVFPWGGGAGSQGGALPVKGGILLDMKRMNRILQFDETSMTITAEAGINFMQLEWFANEKGYSLMHYPSSLTCSTLGGFLAHNGIGVLSTKYGKIDDMCLNIEMAAPNGRILRSAPVPKHSSGPSILHMFVGSEGTLGVITQATMKLFKRPEIRKFRAFLFKDVPTGLAFGRDLLQQFKPSIMRLYNEEETKSIIKGILGVEKEGAFMNIAIEGNSEIVEIEERIALEMCKERGGTDLGSAYGEKWWDSRVTFFYPDHALDLPKMFGTLDTVSTYANIEKIYWALKETIEAFEGVRFIAHFSHWYEWGVMVYDRFIIDNPPEDPEEAMRLHNQIWNAGIRAILENGGVVNDHHGVGLKLGRLMKEQYGENMSVFQALKKELDPNGIMNPFKLGL